MKLPTGIRSFLSLRDVAMAISDMAKAVALGWNVDHKPDGTHKFPWVVVPFDATRYTGSGGMTWTPDSADQALLQYRIIGDTCTLSWRVQASDCSGGSNQLLITLPDGMRAADRVPGWHYYDDAGTEGFGLTRIDSTLTRVVLFKSNSGSNWTNTTSDNTYTEGRIEFRLA